MGLDESHRENWHGRWLFYHYLSHRETKDWTQGASPRWTTKKNHAADKRSPSISHEPERKEQVHHLELCRRKSSSPPRNWGFVGLFSHLIFPEAGQILALQRFPDPPFSVQAYKEFGNLLYVRGFEACLSKVTAFCEERVSNQVTWRFALGVFESTPPGILELSARVVVLYGNLLEKKLLQLLAAGIHDESGPGNSLQ